MRKHIITLLLCLFAAIAYSQRGHDFLLASLQQTSSCITTPGDIFATAVANNAATQCSNEVNGTAGWGGPGVNLDSVEGDTTNGTYAIEIESTSTDGSDRGEITLTLLNSTTYEFSFDYKVTVGVNDEARTRSWTGLTSSPNTTLNNDGNWHTFTTTRTTNSTTVLIRIYASDGPGASGDTVLVDNFTVVAQ